MSKTYLYSIGPITIEFSYEIGDRVEQNLLQNDPM